MLGKAWASILSLLLIGCGAEQSLTTPNQPDKADPSVAIPCPPGMSADQCQMLNLAIAMLRASGQWLCGEVADEIEWQAANTGGLQGVVYLPQPEEFPNHFGGSYWNGSQGEYYRMTVLFPLTFSSAGEVAKTLAHEVAGHQFVSSGEESYAQYMETFCGEQ